MNCIAGVVLQIHGQNIYLSSHTSFPKIAKRSDVILINTIYYSSFDIDFYPPNKWIISNHTVKSDIECALFCSRLDHCFGFGYRSGTMKKEDVINCQLIKYFKPYDIHGHRYGGSLFWTFFQTVNLVSFTLVKVVSHNVRFAHHSEVFDPDLR